MPPRNPPVIVLGMHRSGTSLVTRLLADLGLFIGWKMDAHAESTFFQELNRWTFRQAGVHWDRPEGLDRLLENDRQRKIALDFLSAITESRFSAEYLGPIGSLRHGEPANLPGPWGWKDPRNTFTYPLWEQVYPGAKVIHIVRHGVDVAASLHRRQSENAEKIERVLEAPSIANLYFMRKSRVLDGSVGTLDQAIELWEAYVTRGRRLVDLLGHRAIEVRFEDLCASPMETLEELAAHAGLNHTDPQLADAVEKIDEDRALAHEREDALAAWAKRHEKRIRGLGYSIRRGGEV